MSSAQPTARDYKTIQKWVDAAEVRLSQLAAEMQRSPRPLTLDYTPRWGKAPGARATTRTRQDIQLEKDEVKATTMARVERVTTRAAPATRQRVRDGVFGRLYAEEIQQALATERGLAPPGDSWTLDDRQTRMRLAIKEFRERQQQPPAPPEARTPDDMTDRFLQKITDFRQARTPEPSSSPREPDAPDVA